MEFAEGGDTPSIQQAIRVLQSAPGPAQPEVLRDLGANPPRLVDADQRLSELYGALQQQVDTPDPATAQQKLHDVLSMPRYATLTTGPSFFERAIAAVLDAIGRVLSWLGVGKLHLSVPVWLWFVLALIAVLFIILWPLRGGVTLGGRSAQVRRQPAAARPSMNFFAEADRLAAAGDYAGATRALAGGVAIRLNGERAWDQSPYTVRELFSRSQRPEALRPLLRSFEEASYGDRDIDEAAYTEAAEAARAYRLEAA